MFLYNLLIFAFVILSVLMIFLILMQKGKSSLGFGGMGGGTQLLFGGSGGQDLFQKVTWSLGALFIGGSLFIAILKRPSTSRVLGTIAHQQAPVQRAPEPVIPSPVQEPVATSAPEGAAPAEQTPA